MNLDELEHIEKQMTEGPWAYEPSINQNGDTEHGVSSPATLAWPAGYPVVEGTYTDEENARGIAAMRNSYKALLKVARAAKRRLKKGCNDTCSKALCGAFVCDCGQEDLSKALSDLEGDDG